MCDSYRERKGNSKKFNGNQKDNKMSKKLKIYQRICKKCGERYKTTHRYSKTCSKCRGGPYCKKIWKDNKK